MHVLCQLTATCFAVLQTISQLSARLDSLYASCTSTLEALQSVLPLQHTAEEVCLHCSNQQSQGTELLDMKQHS